MIWLSLPFFIARILKFPTNLETVLEQRDGKECGFGCNGVYFLYFLLGIYVHTL